MTRLSSTLFVFLAFCVSNACGRKAENASLKDSPTVPHLLNKPSVLHPTDFTGDYFLDPKLEGMTLPQGNGVVSALGSGKLSDLRFEVLASTNLLNDLSAAPAEVFKVRLSLDFASPQDSVTGRLILWQPAAQAPIQWSAYGLPGVLGGHVPGKAKLAVSKFSVPKFHIVGEGWLPVEKSLADLNSKHETWLIFEDWRFAASDKRRFKVVHKIKPKTSVSRREDISKLHPVADNSGFFPVAGQVSLPDSSGVAVLPSARPFERPADLIEKKGYLKGTLPFASGKLSYALEYHYFPALNADVLTMGHFIPVKVYFASHSEFARNLKLIAYRTPAVGNPDKKIYGPYLLAQGVVNSMSKIEIPSASFESKVPTHWTPESSYRLQLFAVVGGASVSSQTLFLGTLYQGFQLVDGPTRGSVFPF